MAKPLSKDKAEELLRNSQGNTLANALKRLPPEVDADLACDVVVPMIANNWSFARVCKQLPPRVIQKMLERLDPIARDPNHNDRYVAVLVTSLVERDSDNTQLTADWERALGVLLDLDLSYGWGSKQRRERFASLAADPGILEAIRTTSVACSSPRLDVLAVLCVDGGDSSIDALMSHFVAAEDDGRRLQQLTRLRTHANTDSSALMALLDRLDQRLSKRSEESPAIALARLIGIEVKKQFWFMASVSSHELTSGNVSLYQAHVNVDSRRPTWFAINVSRVDGTVTGRTSFSSDKLNADELELGQCEPHELPEWLKRTSDRLGATWRVGISSNVRGKKRDKIRDWLVRDCQ